MNSNEYTVEVLVKGILISLAIVATAIIIINLPEIVHIISTEGLLSE